MKIELNDLDYKFNEKKDKITNIIMTFTFEGFGKDIKEVIDLFRMLVNRR